MTAGDQDSISCCWIRSKLARVNVKLIASVESLCSEHGCWLMELDTEIIISIRTEAFAG
jgi:hypothetical protein